MTHARLDHGSILLHCLLFSAIAGYIIAGLVTSIQVHLKSGRNAIIRERALQIAESGNEYYRWHLAHAPTDFKDGTNSSGPYDHTVKDKFDNPVGTFSLTITPPVTGSTVVSVKSKGTITGQPTLDRTITTRLAKPSIAKFATVTNAPAIRFGEGTIIHGPVHSNGGIRFDGTAYNIVSSSLTSYDDPDHSGGSEYSVHTHLTTTDPLPPTALPARTDVFAAGRQLGVPSVDFSGITADLATMLSQAQSSGFYRTSSGALGYELVLKTNDTFDLYRVNSTTSVPSGCTNTQSETGWGTWGVNTRTLLGTYSFPSNGLLFFEDHVYVRGQINTAKIMIIAARLPDSESTRRNISITNDILYTNYDGQDVIGLIAQNNVNIGMASENDLRIDAALIAQQGRVGRYYYPGPSGGSNRCNPYHERATLTLWGMIATNGRYGFAWTDGNGYDTRTISYDGSLLYNPPPSTPLTSDQYFPLSWEEIE